MVKYNPSSDIPQKLAQALDTTSDFLMNGASDEAVSAQLADKELLNQFKAVEKLSPEDKHLNQNFHRCLSYQKADSKIITLKKPNRIFRLGFIVATLRF